MAITIEQNAEVYNYFIEKYRKAPFRMLPGDIPVFKSKEEVDQWIATFSRMPEVIKNMVTVMLMILMIFDMAESAS